MRIDFSEKTVASFDVFDTCISRTYEHPTDLFLHLGYRISPTALRESEKIAFAAQFRTNRILAERLANRRLGKHCNSNLHTIYKLIELPSFCTYTAEEVEGLEIAMEISCSYGIHQTKKKIEHFRALKVKIIYISDMYLPVEVVANLLRKNEIIDSNENLYVSSEHIVTKHSGKLYQHVLDELGTAASTITHHGDNHHADIKMAVKMGLEAEHINDTAILEAEKIFANARTDFTKSILNSIPKYLRLSRPSTLSKSELLYFGLIAPCIVSFTAWTLAKARELKLDTLYFVSRDAELPFKIAQNISIHFGIEVKYLFGSRKAWLLPSVENPDSWKGIATPVNMESSLKDALERLQFTPEEVTRIQKTHKISDVILNQKQDKKSLDSSLELIINSSEVSFYFKEKIESQRKSCIKYLEDEGLFSDKKWAIVDSGWSLNTQGCLKRILNSAGYTKEITGLYFGIAPYKFLKTNAGSCHSFTESDPFYFNRAATIEHCIFPSAENSLSHYEIIEDRSTPKFMKNDQSNFDIYFSNELHKYSLIYTDTFLKLQINPTVFVENKIEIIKNVRNFISNPNEEIVNYLSNLSITIDARHSQETKLIFFNKISPLSFIKIFLPYIAGTKKEVYFWPEASAKLSHPIIKWVLIILLKFKNKHKIRDN